jgi:uncharacterized protein
MFNVTTSKRLFTILALCCLAVCFFSKDSWARAVPPLSGPVVDEANLLSREENTILTEKLKQYHQNNGKQLQVLIIRSLEGDNLEDYSIRVAEQWKIGQHPGTGVILLSAIKERQLRIEVGSALEGDLTDAQAGRIINQTIVPLFKQGKFYLGIAAGLEEISRTLKQPLGLLDENDEKNLYKGNRSQGPPPHRDSLNLLFWLLFIIIFIISNIFRKRRGFLGSNYRNSGWWGGGGFGGGGGFSGGGGWSGGGGGFSGGGASGRW